MPNRSMRMGLVWCVAIALIAAPVAYPTGPPEEIHASGYVECAAATEAIESRILLDFARTRWIIYQAWDAVMLKERRAASPQGPRLRVDPPRRPDTAQLGFQSPLLTFGRIKTLGLYRRMVSPDGVRAWSTALTERDGFAVDTARSAVPLQGVYASPPLVDAWFVRYRDEWESVGFSAGPGRRTRWLAVTGARERLLAPPSLLDEGWLFDTVPCRAVESDRLGVSFRTDPFFDRWSALGEGWVWSAPGFGVGSCVSGAARASLGGVTLRAHGRYATAGFREPDGDTLGQPAALSAEIARGGGKRRWSASLRFEGEGPAVDPVAAWMVTPEVELRFGRLVRCRTRAAVDVAGSNRSPRSWSAEESLVLSAGAGCLRFETSTEHTDGAPPGTIDLGATLRTRSRGATLRGSATWLIPEEAWTDAKVAIDVGDTRGLSASASVAATTLEPPESLVGFIAASNYEAEIAVRYRWK